jgi:meiotically up-regulated gene 157 (Mug157) protein
MSIPIRAWPSNHEREIHQSLRWFHDTIAGTGFMHESFHKEDAGKFARSWFEWANTAFNE